MPLIPLLEAAGKVGATLPLQKAGIAVKVGVVAALTTTLVEVVAEQPLASVTVT